MKTAINWGILGTSFISEVMAKAIQESQNSRLIAIGSRSQASAKNFANQFTIPRPYDNYESLLNDQDVDALYIGLPNHLHKEWIIRAARAGKNILCEKPFVTNIDDANEVISVIKNSNVFCMEALMYRYHPFTKKLEEIIENKTLGTTKLYNATYTADIADIANPTAGGSIRNLGCYPVSLIRLLAKAEPIEINGIGRLNSKNNNDNQASVILKFADKSMAVVSTADDLKMAWQFDIYGTEGFLKVITNPWLPERDNNKILIHSNHDNVVTEINIKAEKSLYTYQIELASLQILNKGMSDFNESTLFDSLGNTIVLEKWLQQVKHETLMSC